MGKKYDTIFRELRRREVNQLEKYESKLAAAYVRGVAMERRRLLPPELTEKPLDALNEREMARIICAGEAAELRKPLPVLLYSCR